MNLFLGIPNPRELQLFYHPTSSQHYSVTGLLFSTILLHRVTPSLRRFITIFSYLRKKIQHYDISISHIIDGYIGGIVI